MKISSGIIGITGLLAATASATTLLVDFGDSASITTGVGDTWNNVTSASTGIKSTNLRTTTDASTNYGLNITVSGFSGSTDINQSSASFTPANAYRDGFYGAFPGSGLGSSTILLTGLDPATTYTFTFFGSVNRAETRASRYTIGDQFVELEARNNVSTWSQPISATPDSSGNLEIIMSRATANTSQSYMLNVMKIDYIPEPGTAMLSAFALLPLLRRRR